MGCVPSKALRKAPEKLTWHSPMSRNTYASTDKRWDSDEEDDHMVSLTSSSYGVLNTHPYYGSFLNMAKRERFAILSGTDMKQTRGCVSMKPGPIKDEVKSVLIHDGTKGHGSGVINTWEPLMTCTGRKPAKAYDQSKCLPMPQDSFAILSGSDVKQTRAWESAKSAKLKPAAPYNESKCLLMHDDSRGHAMEVINTWELMEGLEDSTRTPSPLKKPAFGKLCVPEKQISFNTSQPSIGELGSPVWKKYYIQEDEMGVGNPSFAGYSNMPSFPPTSPFNESPRRAPSQSSFVDVEDTRSVSSFDGSTSGLKLLLSPANSYPSPMIKKAGSHSTTLSFDGTMHLSVDLYDAKSTYRSPDTTRCSSRKPSMDSVYGSSRYEHIHVESQHVKSPYRSPDRTRPNSRKPSMESVLGSGSPLFDPSIMATFEEALKATTTASYEEWMQFSVDESITHSSSSADTWISSETASDAESMPAFHNRDTRTSPTKILPIHEDEVKSKTLLASYEMKCPPRGENAVVLYFTSLRGIRKTYEDCCTLRLILRGLGVQVDERDVWMHSKFKEELMDVLRCGTKGGSQVPQLFIKGRYIGGAEEVKQLHEEGILAGLMDGLAMGMIFSICDGCGDARFVPCLNCNGSCKVVNDDYEMLRCPDCNENGLIMCPICHT